MSINKGFDTNRELELTGKSPEKEREFFIGVFDQWLGNWRYNNRMKKATTYVNRHNVVSRSKSWGELGLAEKILKRVNSKELFLREDEATKLYELKELSGLEWGIVNENGATTSINPQTIEALKTILLAVINKSQAHEKDANLIIARNKHGQSERDMVAATERENLVNIYGERFLNIEKVMMELLDPTKGLPVVGDTDLSCYEPKKVTLSGKKVRLYRGDNRVNPQDFFSNAVYNKGLTIEDLAFVREYLMGLTSVIDFVSLNNAHTNRDRSEGRVDPVVSFTKSMSEARSFAGVGGVIEVEIPVEWTIEASLFSYRLQKKFEHRDRGDVAFSLRRYEGDYQPGKKEEVYVWGGLSISELER